MIIKSNTNLITKSIPLKGQSIKIEEFSNLVEPKNIQIVIVKYDKKFFGDSVRLNSVC